MAKQGKNYLSAAAQVNRAENYSPNAAMTLTKDLAAKTAKFDATIELHIRTGLDPRKADQQIRTSVVLPHGLGKSVRVLVFAEGDDARAAQEAGADFVADDETIQKILDGWTDFDVAIAVPAMMGKVGRLGRVLGPRGLMPNPRAGTVAPGSELPQIIREAKAGRVEFRLDKTGNIHVPLGKASFPVESLLNNMASVMDAVRRAKPTGAKGAYLRRVTLTSTMGPGVRVDVNAAESMTPTN